MSLKDFLTYQAKTTPNPLGLEVSKAKGSYIFDSKGKKYLDFVAGISACSLGHRHPEIIKAIKKQLNKFLHVMVYGEYVQEPTVKLCKKLASLLPKNLEVTFLTNSGTEAIEGAMKLAKRYTKKSNFIAAKNSYHGSTQGALSLLGVKNQKKGYGPLLPKVNFIDFNSNKDLIKIDNNTAAVILETVQGGAGFIIPKTGYLNNVKKRCREVGALLILDEIQPGIGRTGNMFAFQKYDVEPDILVIGKGLGGGLPIGAFCSSREMMKKFEYKPSLGHISTFGGNPVIASAGLSVLETLENEKILEKIKKKEKLIRSLLKHKKIKSINGTGLMLAIILERKSDVEKLVKESMGKGLILFYLLWNNLAVRITPPLNISDRDLIKGCKIILKILDEML
ncbi:MAG: aspartate aminotransferase family protein [Flavobacteriales bacterium TMED96]|nr:MAG: aspartate aminotransferase family protein [Flavobacteriales bacterium TMED96]